MRSAIATHASIPTRNGSIATQPIVVSTFGVCDRRSPATRGSRRRAVGIVGNGAHFARQARRSARRRRSDAERFAYVGAGFRRLARLLRRRSRARRREAGHRNQPLHGEVRVGPLRASSSTRTTAGVPLQGAVFYPAGYEPGKKYPMVVYMYEKLSDGVHRFVAPVRARLLQRRRLHDAAATSSCSPTSSSGRASRASRSSSASARRCSSRRDGRSPIRRKVGISRPLVGRIRQRVSRDAHRHFRGRSRRRADHRSRQQLRQPSLVERHRRDRSHRDGPAAHGGAALRRPAGVHPQLGGVQRAAR